MWDEIALAQVGVTMFEGDDARGDQALVRADRAMYDAKRRGRDQWAELSSDAPASVMSA